MLKIKDLCVTAEGKSILKHFNIQIKDGEIHVLMGPNGAGKSTVCKSIMHHPHYKITSGTILFRDKDITNRSVSEIAQLGMYYISQNPIELEGTTNAEMLRTAMSARGIKMDIFTFQKKCTEICNKLSMPKSFLHRHVNVGMSGGERKKNELLHMWMLEPNFILFDEIDSGLDVDALKIVGKNIKEYCESHHASVLLITHQQALIDFIQPDFIHIISDGKILESGNMNLAKEIEKNGFLHFRGTNEMKESGNHE